jgi:hypothetical protein
MKTTFHENPYAVDDGRFLARFKGIEWFKSDTAKDKNGDPMPPGWKWEFELCEGADSGKIANIITPSVPTLKNKCGRMMMALSDGIIQDGMEFDSDRYKGHYYRITIREGIISDNPPPSFVGARRPSENTSSDSVSEASQRSVGDGNKERDDPVPF